MSRKFPVTGILSLIAALALAGCATTDYTKGQSGICEVHHVTMTKRAVPFAHGMIPMSADEAGQGEWKQRTTYYPHPGDCEPATDIVMPGETARVIVFVCPACEQAKKLSDAKQPHSPRLSPTEALKMADTFATKTLEKYGPLDLKFYPDRKAMFEPKNGKWWIMYFRNPNRYPGDHFSISIDDATGTARYHGGA